jgi:phosphohistidine phosphatase
MRDFDRVLDRRGQSEAAITARRCFDLGLVPDLILTSPAERARQTAAIFVRELELSSRVLFEQAQVYDAEVADLLAAIAMVSPRIGHLLLVGHNPGVSLLARHLAQTAPVEDFATAAAGTLQLDSADWQSLTAGCGSSWQYGVPQQY